MSVRHFLDTGRLFDADLTTLLDSHPESFDILIYPAEGKAQDETVSLVPLAVSRLDSEEREQSYLPPEAGRAYIIPEDGFRFDDMSGNSEVENFAEKAMKMLVSKPLRKFSIITWEEYRDLTMTEIVTRAVYVWSTKPMGRTLNVGCLCTCVPLPDKGLLEEIQNG